MMAKSNNSTRGILNYSLDLDPDSLLLARSSSPTSLTDEEDSFDESDLYNKSGCLSKSKKHHVK